MWNKYQRSTQAADAAQEACGRAIVVQCETRWNSKWDSVNVLLSINANESKPRAGIAACKLNEVCAKMEITTFKQSEIEFLAELARINRPLALALDAFQGDKTSYYGMLLPKLSVLMFEPKQLSGTVNLLMKPLVNSLLSGVTKRFTMLNLDDDSTKTVILAAVSNPMCKLRWLPQASRKKIERLFIDHVRDNFHTVLLSSSSKTAVEGTMADEFHMFKGKKMQLSSVGVTSF